MSASSAQGRLLDRRSRPYLLVLLCVAVLYAPVYIGLAQDVWPIEDDFHGPIILAICLWLAWQRLRDFATAPADDPAGRAIGWVALSIGLLLYALGRSQDIYMLSLGSQLLVFPGAILVIRGWPSLRPVWFPIFFLVFIEQFRPRKRGHNSNLSDIEFRILDEI
jgi:hypothetical protein